MEALEVSLGELRVKDWKRYYGSSKELADDVATQGRYRLKEIYYSTYI